MHKRQSDGSFSRLVISGTALSLTTNTWYEAKVVVDTDPMDDPCQRLRFWVDTDNDGDYADETTLITSTAVDDVWSAGYVGLYRYPGGSSVQELDDVRVGYDNTLDTPRLATRAGSQSELRASPGAARQGQASDGDILDAGDDVQVADNFSSAAMSLSYDAEADRGGRAKGNLTLDTAGAAARHGSLRDWRTSLAPRRQGWADDGVLRLVYDAWNP